MGRKVSFGFGLVIYCNICAWIAATYGYFFISGNLDFTPGQLRTFTFQLVVALVITSLASYIQFGMLKPLGIPGLGKKFPLVNRLLDRDPFGEKLDRLNENDLENLFKAVGRLSVHCTVSVLLYSFAVVMTVTHLTVYYTDSSRFSVVIFTGGVIASIVNSYFSFILAEYWIAPVRRNIQAELYRRGIEFQSRRLSSYKQHFLCGIALLLLTQVVLVQYMLQGNQSLVEIAIFMVAGIFTLYFIIYMLLNSFNIFLSELGDSTRNLAEGRSGLLFPSYSYKELINASGNYNSAAAEVDRIRRNMEQAIEERTRELKIARDQAEALNKVKDEFLANMSHEIRTPLNGIIGLVDLMNSTDITDQQKEYLEMARNSGEALLDIVNAVLDFSQLETGILNLQETIFKPRALVRKAMETFTPAAAEKGLRLTYRVSAEIPGLLVGDPQRLRQILINLMDNAVKFTEKGDIKLSMDILEEDEKSVRVIFSVSDTGIGIPADRIEKIFSSFTQVDGSMTRKYGGAGLGLTISGEIVRAMGGSLRVESREKEGSRFYFILTFGKADPQMENDVSLDDNHTTQELTPREDIKQMARSAIETARKRETDNEPRPVKILLAEDNAVNRKLAVALIKKKGWTVTAVENGKEALDLLLLPSGGVREYFDLILMDVQMPEMDGLETTRRIRREPALKSLPIIALTAHALKGDRERFLSEGMTDYLAKPIKADSFYQMLQKHLIAKS